MLDRQPLAYNTFYHIYNRGINGENIFEEERNYTYFLQLYSKHVRPIADTYAYCLLRNHFHFMIRTKSEAEQEEWWARNKVPEETRAVFTPMSPSFQFRIFFNAYAKAFNKAYKRTGGLFENPFKRIVVDKYGYYIWLIIYLHRNPQKHGFVTDFREWKYSSYKAILSRSPTHIQRQTVLDWFGGRDAFLDAHKLDVDERRIKALVVD
jgi:hypothetical protein